MGNSSALWLVVVENIAEVFFESGQSLLVPITGNNHLVKVIEASQFIDAVNMVRVGMGIEDAVNLFDAIGQTLLAQVG